MTLRQTLRRIPVGSRREQREAYRKLRLIQSRCDHIWPPCQPHDGRIGQGTITCERCLLEAWVSRDGQSFFVPSFEDEWEADDRLLYAVMPDGSLRFIPDPPA